LTATARRRLLTALAALALLLALAWHHAHRWLPGAVNLARALPGVSFGRMHRLERDALDAWDRLHRLGQPTSARRPPTSPPDALRDLWPPPPLLPLLASPDPTEGAWASPQSPCLPPRAADALSLTTLRVDPLRPDVPVTLLAVDLRRVGLQLVPGRDDGGDGLLHACLQANALATFHGGFQAEHGAFGLRVDNLDLLPMRDGAATLGQERSGRLLLQPWPAPPLDGAPWLRQNLQMLVYNGEIQTDLHVFADGRREPIGHSLTRRAGLCLRGEHTLIYLWTWRGTAQTLAEAMIAAGCRDGMHLDLNAFHTGFEWISLRDAHTDGDGAWQGACAERLHPRMTDRPLGRHLSPQDRDFFVLFLR
jgi:hypothetical protein